MKILIITPSYKPAYIYGGPIFSVAYLAEELSKSNEVLVLSTTANGKEELDLVNNNTQFIEGVSVNFFNRQTKDHTHFSIGLLKYLWINGGNFELIHIQSWWNLVAIFSALICWIKGWKYIITPRGMLSPYTFQSSILKKTIHFFIGNFLLRKAILHATSTDEASKIQSLNSNYIVKVIPNFVNLHTPIIERTKTDVFELLFLSRIHPKKGLDVLIESLPLLQFNFHLNIVGEGDLSYIESLGILSEDLNVADKITWHGSLYDNHKFEMYAKSDLMILPSHDENFANNVLESLLMGTPVVVSNNVGLATFVQQNELGFVFSGDRNQLANTINSAYKNSELREQISIRARSIVLQKFDNRKLINEYLEMYKSI